MGKIIRYIVEKMFQTTLRLSTEIPVYKPSSVANISEYGC